MVKTPVHRLDRRRQRKGLWKGVWLLGKHFSSRKVPPSSSLHLAAVASGMFAAPQATSEPCSDGSRFSQCSESNEGARKWRPAFPPFPPFPATFQESSAATMPNRCLDHPAPPPASGLTGLLIDVPRPRSILPAGTRMSRQTSPPRGVRPAQQPPARPLPEHPSSQPLRS